MRRLFRRSSGRAILHPMKLFVGVTDSDWFEMLRSQPALDEVNFWQPGGSRQFKTLQEGELFLFKLHAPRNFTRGPL